jgi:hypothetical protein
MENIEAKQNRFGWCLAAAALLPIVLESIYLFFSRWPSYHFTEFSDWAGSSISIVVGSAFVAFLPLRKRWRVISLIIYVPVLFGLLIIYDLMFIALVFHDGP